VYQEEKRLRDFFITQRIQNISRAFWKLLSGENNNG